jgi:hypothetical protein
LRLTRTPELLGGMAGAVVGMAGGWLFAPWVGALFIPGRFPSEAEVAGRTAASVGACPILGAALGIFQDLLFRTLYKWVGDPPRDYSVLTGEFAAKELNRRMGV